MLSLVIFYFYAECHYAEFHNFLIVMLNVILLSIVMLNVILLSVVMLNVILPSVVMLNVLTPYFTVAVNYNRKMFMISDNRVNNWASDATKGKIPDLLDVNNFFVYRLVL
jgi:hypothetical protein